MCDIDDTVIIRIISLFARQTKSAGLKNFGPRM